MSKRAANIFFIFADIFAIGGVILAFQIFNAMWDDIHQHVEQIAYSNGPAYFLLGIILPVVHLLFIPWFKQFEKFIVYGFSIYTIVGILITPRIIEYYIKNELIKNDYTYCGSKRNGNIRYTDRIWMLDASCGDNLTEQDGNSKKKSIR